jgi:2-polyprenyl-6-methoxyphenol hydroxylase-like FAD-dependent oxidoreductase
VSSTTTAPIQVGTVGADGALSTTRRVTRPTSGQDWWFALVCAQPSANPCGTDEVYSAVTAPIWFAA